MSNELTNILCSCKEGTLEEIALTELSCGALSWNGEGQIIFYECDYCKKIFQREKSMSMNGKEIYQFSNIWPYKGRLTKQEIIDNAKEFIGYLYAQDEEKIISQRKS